jgi:pyruvate dehydrogenase E2 component (dihydrolipoamide acetyltransferase)
MPEVIMPRLSDTMEEGTLSRWLKAPGDAVHRGEVIAEIETDKATMDLEAYEDGVLEQILLAEGQVAPIGQIIATIGTGYAPSGASGVVNAADSIPATGDAPGSDGMLIAATEPDEETDPNPSLGVVGASGHSEAAGPDVASAPGRHVGVMTSPLVRALAKRHGISLEEITASGPGGRIMRKDVEGLISGQEGELADQSRPADGFRPPSTEHALAPALSPSSTRSVAAPEARDSEVEEIPLSRLRKVTAERLAISTQVPHFDLTTIIDAEPLLGFRAEINADGAPEGTKVSVTDLLVKACAKVLRAHPEVNVSFGGDKILQHRRVNIGVAVAVSDGLMVPVIHDADRKALGEIAVEARELAARARAGRLTLEELSAGTFTISNLGMFGIDHFTAVINPPQAAILAVGAASAEPVVRGGEVVAGTTIKATLSVDHRVLDGATGASFLSDLRDLVHHPIRMVV